MSGIVFQASATPVGTVVSTELEFRRSDKIQAPGGSRPGKCNLKLQKRKREILLATVAILATVTCAGEAVAQPSWKRLPVVPDIRGSLKKSFKKDVSRSDRRDMNPKVFAKVGDSNTEMAPALYGLACRKPRLAGRFRLRATVKRYNRVKLPNERPIGDCSPSTSFSRRSAASRSGTFSSWPLLAPSDLPASGFLSAPSDCRHDETPLICEIRTIKPRYTIIMTGTNDQLLDNYLGLAPGEQTTSRMNHLIDEVRRLGSVPVVSTIPPRSSVKFSSNAANPVNAGIVESARRKKVPVINLWRAMMARGMYHRGTDIGGTHLGTAPDVATSIFEVGPATFEDSVDFRPEALRYGSNRRNLTWLKTLKALDRATKSK